MASTPSQQPKPRRTEAMGGVIEFRGALGAAVAVLGRRIVGGEWRPGDAMPRGADLCAELGVGRSVIREAFRVLDAKGLIRYGTRVLPREEWRLLDPDVMDRRIEAGERRRLLLDLLRVRGVLEPGVVREATLQAGPGAALRLLFDLQMRAASREAWSGWRTGIMASTRG